MDNIIEILSKIFLFENVEEEIVKKCCNQSGYTVLDFSPGDILMDSESEKYIGIILTVKASIISNDGGVIIKKLIKNDIYGVAKLFDATKYPTKIIANSKCSVIAISKDFIERCIEYEKQISLNYIKILAKKISFLNNKINSYTAKSTEGKLYAYLLQIPRENNKIVLKSDFSSIAKMLGIGRASLYRAFEKLENDGLIIKKDKEILLKEV